MALHMQATRPTSALLALPWGRPLADWDPALYVPLARGISRHVVRFVQLESAVYAVKETRESFARGEYSMLRKLTRLGLPVVEPVAVVTGRAERDGAEIEPALVTRHLTYSLPYRALFSTGADPERLSHVVDALVVLLVRLHLAGFYWGDCSLSNTLFRRTAGEFAAYLVDAETGELHESLSDGQRAHDIDLLHTNIFGELLDLQAGGLLDDGFDAHALVDQISLRYAGLWHELTGTEEFGIEQMWRIEQRVERLNDLGFDIDELELVTDIGGATVRIQPKVVDAGHHARRLGQLTGLDLEEPQARRLLNDVDSFAAAHDMQAEDPAVVAHRWLTGVYEPLLAMIPPELADVVEPAEVFHDVLIHKWYLSEQAGREVDFAVAARSYLDRVHDPQGLSAGAVEL